LSTDSQDLENGQKCVKDIGKFSCAVCNNYSVISDTHFDFEMSPGNSYTKFKVLTAQNLSGPFKLTLKVEKDDLFDEYYLGEIDIKKGFSGKFGFLPFSGEGKNENKISYENKLSIIGLGAATIIGISIVSYKVFNNNNITRVENSLNKIKKIVANVNKYYNSNKKKEYVTKYSEKRTPDYNESNPVQQPMGNYTGKEYLEPIYDNSKYEIDLGSPPVVMPNLPRPEISPDDPYSPEFYETLDRLIKHYLDLKWSKEQIKIYLSAKYNVSMKYLEQRISLLKYYYDKLKHYNDYNLPSGPEFTFGMLSKKELYSITNEKINNMDYYELKSLLSQIEFSKTLINDNTAYKIPGKYTISVYQQYSYDYEYMSKLNELEDKVKNRLNEMPVPISEINIQTYLAWLSQKRLSKLSPEEKETALMILDMLSVEIDRREATGEMTHDEAKSSRVLLENLRKRIELNIENPTGSVAEILQQGGVWIKIVGGAIFLFGAGVTIVGVLASETGVGSLLIGPGIKLMEAGGTIYVVGFGTNTLGDVLDRVSCESIKNEDEKNACINETQNLLFGDLFEGLILVATATLGKLVLNKFSPRIISKLANSDRGVKLLKYGFKMTDDEINMFRKGFQLSEHDALILRRSILNKWKNVKIKPGKEGEVAEVAAYERLKLIYSEKNGYKILKNVKFKLRDGTLLESDLVVVKDGKIISVAEVKTGANKANYARKQLDRLFTSLRRNEVVEIKEGSKVLNLKLSDNSIGYTIGPSDGTNYDLSIPFSSSELHNVIKGLNSRWDSITFDASRDVSAGQKLMFSDELKDSDVGNWILKMNSKLPEHLKIRRIKFVRSTSRVSGETVDDMVAAVDKSGTLYINIDKWDEFSSNPFILEHEFGHLKFNIDYSKFDDIEKLNAPKDVKKFARDVLYHEVEGDIGALKYGDNPNIVDLYLDSEGDSITLIKSKLLEFGKHGGVPKGKTLEADKDVIFAAKYYVELKQVGREDLANEFIWLINKLPAKQKSLFNNLVRIYTEAITGGGVVE